MFKYDNFLSKLLEKRLALFSLKFSANI